MSVTPRGSVDHILKLPSSVPVSTQITHTKLGLTVEISLMDINNFPPCRVAL